ncbi:hypothetical protein EYF80_024016 [Liparis tanakae]|uniref:Uncharacterized protein n=1 Tax=Liparis tanakae TaxID=230148 RepID=A0A4Z2HL62_9TELE|nr:hypothetical protein EYF80_024016 [Liparis tanakae]
MARVGGVPVKLRFLIRGGIPGPEQSRHQNSSPIVAAQQRNAIQPEIRRDLGCRGGWRVEGGGGGKVHQAKNWAEFSQSKPQRQRDGPDSTPDQYNFVLLPLHPALQPARCGFLLAAKLKLRPPQQLLAFFRKEVLPERERRGWGGGEDLIVNICFSFTPPSLFVELSGAPGRHSSSTLPPSTASTLSSTHPATHPSPGWLTVRLKLSEAKVSI